MSIPAPKRAMCGQCLRAQAACICRWITSVASAVEVLILQHPMEVAHAKGSGRLLHLCLPGSVMLVGEQFAPVELQAALLRDGRTPVLLYPETPAGTSPVVTQERLPSPLRLVVLDGTWRKSRKMLYLNPLLQQLPRLALADLPATRYAIRKAHAVDQLSTLEATCYALMRIECNEAKFQPLLSAFDGFVAQQAATIPTLSHSPA